MMVTYSSIINIEFPQVNRKSERGKIYNILYLSFVAEQLDYSLFLNLTITTYKI